MIMNNPGPRSPRYLPKRSTATFSHWLGDLDREQEIDANQRRTATIKPGIPSTARPFASQHANDEHGEPDRAHRLSPQRGIPPLSALKPSVELITRLLSDNSRSRSISSVARSLPRPLSPCTRRKLAQSLLAVRFVGWDLLQGDKCTHPLLRGSVPRISSSR